MSSLFVFVLFSIPPKSRSMLELEVVSLCLNKQHASCLLNKLHTNCLSLGSTVGFAKLFHFCSLAMSEITNYYLCTSVFISYIINRTNILTNSYATYYILFNKGSKS